jgi:hypothetical protein
VPLFDAATGSPRLRGWMWASWPCARDPHGFSPFLMRDAACLARRRGWFARRKPASHLTAVQTKINRYHRRSHFSNCSRWRVKAPRTRILQARERTPLGERISTEIPNVPGRKSQGCDYWRCWICANEACGCSAQELENLWRRVSVAFGGVLPDGRCDSIKKGAIPSSNVRLWQSGGPPRWA